MLYFHGQVPTDVVEPLKTTVNLLLDNLVVHFTDIAHKRGQHMTRDNCLRLFFLTTVSVLRITQRSTKFEKL